MQVYRVASMHRLAVRRQCASWKQSAAGCLYARESAGASTCSRMSRFDFHADDLPQHLFESHFGSRRGFDWFLCLNSEQLQ